MGYTTDFTGSFEVTPALKPEHRAYLEAFNNTRRMARDGTIVKNLPDPVREAAQLPALPDYYVGAAGQSHGQQDTPDILNYNKPPRGQPSLWCQWVPSEDGREIVWDGGEKFYEYVLWLRYIINHFLQPWGYRVNGTVEWQGEESDDRGRIVVKNNAIKTARPTVTWP